MHMNDNIKNVANFNYVVMQKRRGHPVLRGEPPFFFFLIEKEETRIYLNGVNPLNPDFIKSESCFLSSNWFFDCRHSFIDKLLKTEGKADRTAKGYKFINRWSRLGPLYH